MLNGAIEDFNFAARVKGHGMNVIDAVPADARTERDVFRVPGEQESEKMFQTGRRAVPDGADAACQRHSGKLSESRSRITKRLETPHLNVAYKAPAKSVYTRT